MLCRSSPLSEEAQSARPAPLAPGAVSARIGTELGCSDWITVSQDRIDRFAECTEDRQFIHIDPERASQTPFGGPIAHGFLSLGLLSAMAYDALPDLTGAQIGVNYGFDRVRFVSPVRAGSAVRGRFMLADAQSTPAHVTLHLDVTVEIDGSSRPALVARWINRHVLAP